MCMPRGVQGSQEVSMQTLKQEAPFLTDALVVTEIFVKLPLRFVRTDLAADGGQGKDAVRCRTPN